MTSGVYVILNSQNGHLYIGSAVNVANRWGHHRPLLRQGRHHSSHLQRAWNKYGEAAFRFTVLEECEPEELVALEQSWMDNFLPEYNMAPTAGSSLGTRCSEEKRAKLSASGMGHEGWMKGKKHPPEVCARISAAKKGKPNGLLGKKRPGYKARTVAVSRETRAKLSAAAKGKRHSAESRQKMSVAKKGRKVTAETRQKMSAAMRETWGKTPTEVRETWLRGVRKWTKTPEAHETHLRVGREIRELAKTPEGREVFARAGRIGGSISGHIRSHVNRGIVNPDCPHCKAAKP